MKNKSIKYLYIVGSAILCLGIGITAFAFSMVNFNLEMITTDTQFEILNYNATNKINEISIDVRDAAVIINPTNNDKITIEYKENSKYKYNIVEENSALSITCNDVGFNIFDYVFTINITSPSFVINVPKDIIYDLSVKTSNGTIQSSDLNTSNLKFETSNGSVLVENSTCNNILDIKTSNNKIELTNIDTNDVLLKTSNGRVELNNIKTKNNINVATSNNRVVIKNSTCYDMDIQTSNGLIDLNNVFVLNNITGQTSNHKILLTAVDFAKNLNLTTSNGSIKGDIKGTYEDFSFECTTSSNNKSNLPESLIAGAKLIKLKTSNSDIEIDFS